MTLERLNNRSVKSIKRMIVVGLSLILTTHPITSTLRCARAGTRVPSTISSPALQRAAATAHLKERSAMFIDSRALFFFSSVSDKSDRFRS
jgi:hypothetical protein